MLTYFIKNRHGSVSVFCAMILTVILSFSSLMVEIGRMRSINALFSEAMDNAAFSVLSNYDAALYKRFALLALNPDVDDETFNNYLKATLNQKNEDKTILDSGASLSVDATMDTVYDLADENVLKSQIEELNKYRGVMDIANNFVDYEGAIKDIIGYFEKNLVYLNFFTKITDRADVIIEYIAAIGNYYNATKDLDKNQQSYYDTVTDYNETRSDYEEVVSDSDSTDEEKAAAESQLNQKKSNLESAIDELHEAIYNLVEAEADYQTALGNMSDDLVSSIISEEVAALDSGGESYQSLTAQEKQNYKEFLIGMNADIDISQGILDRLSNFLQNAVLDILSDYAEDVKSSKSLISTESNYTAVRMNPIDEMITDISALCSTLLTIINDVVTLIKNIIQTLEVFLGFSNCIDALVTMKLGFSPYYNNSIVGAQNLPYGWNDLFSDANDVDYSAILEPDKQLVTSEYESTLAKEVANEVGYNLDYINPGVNVEKNLINNIIENITYHLQNVGEAIKFLVNNKWNIINKFNEIKDAFKSLIYNAKKVLEYIYDFVKLMTSIVVDAICDMIYSHIIVADYAIGTFPNRTTEITDTNILGEKWSDYLGGWAQYDDMHMDGLSMSSNTNFSKCRAEYLIGGMQYESMNQQIVYFLMLCQRFTASTPAIFTNKYVREPLIKLCETGLGAIIAVIIGIIYVYIEASIDMLMLTYGGQELPIIKVKPWLTEGGIGKLVGSLMDIKAKKLTKATICDWAETNFATTCSLGGVAAGYISKPGNVDKMKSFINRGYSHAKKILTPKTTLPALPELPDGSSGASGTGGSGNVGMTIATSIIDFLMPKWDYTDYLMMYVALMPEDLILGRMENLIQLEMQQAYDNDFYMKNAKTYIRVEATVKYKPILPMPVISNMKALEIHQIKYEGY